MIQLNKEDFYNKFIKENKTLKEISHETGYAISTLAQYSRIWNIRKRDYEEIIIPRNFNSKILTKELLTKEYIDNRMSSVEIAKKYNSYKDTVLGRLKRFGIIKRTKQDYTENLKGKRYGKLLVLEKSTPAYDKNHSTRWLCECDCGKRKRIKATVLKRGYNTSCGCMETRRGSDNGMWQGYKGLPKTYYTRIRYGAKSRKLCFKVSIEYLWNLFEKQNQCCTLTGHRLYMPRGNYLDTKQETLEKVASLDRIDSSKGYIEGNVRWIWKPINLIRMDYTDEEFIGFCKDVAKYHENITSIS